MPFYRFLIFFSLIFLFTFSISTVFPFKQKTLLYMVELHEVPRQAYSHFVSSFLRNCKWKTACTIFWIKCFFLGNHLLKGIMFVLSDGCMILWRQNFSAENWWWCPSVFAFPEKIVWTILNRIIIDLTRRITAIGENEPNTHHIILSNTWNVDNFRRTKRNAYIIVILEVITMVV